MFLLSLVPIGVSSNQKKYPPEGDVGCLYPLRREGVLGTTTKDSSSRLQKEEGMGVGTGSKPTLTTQAKPRRRLTGVTDRRGSVPDPSPFLSTQTGVGPPPRREEKRGKKKRTGGSDRETQRDRKKEEECP